MKESTIWWILGAAAVGGGAWWLYQQSQNGPVTYVALASGSTDMSVAVPTGNTINVSLPAGAVWNQAAADTTKGTSDTPVTGSSPVTFQYGGPGTYVFGWTDASGTNQSTAIAFTTAGAPGTASAAPGTYNLAPTAPLSPGAIQT